MRNWVELCKTDDVGYTSFDLSKLAYEEFTRFFFDRLIIPQGEGWVRAHANLFEGGIDYFVASEPTAVVRNMVRTFQDWGELAKIYSYEQLEQGSSFTMLGGGIECQQYLYDDNVPLALRLECIEAMYIPFAAVVNGPAHPIEKSDRDREDEYFMWWDKILWSLWLFVDLKTHSTVDYAQLDNDLRQIVDASFETLSRILEIDHRYCQECALHGLGHSKHPLVHETVQRYIESHRDTLTREELSYAEYARDGNVM